jgi:cytochrome c-type biogenesis protein CcmH/NrfG
VINLHRPALLQRAAVCIREMNWLEARSILQEMLAKNPRDVEALALMSRVVWNGDSDPDGGLEMLRQCVEIQPRHAGMLSLLADMLVTRGQFAESEKVYRRALRLNARKPNLVVGLANALEKRGDDDEAIEYLQRMQASGFDDPRAIVVLARIDLKRKQAQQAVHRLEPITRGERVLVSALFILGRALETLGDYDRAFDAYTRANAMRHGEYKVHLDLDRVRSLLSVFTRERLARIPRPPQPSDVPMFIVGRPRSGTTLLEAILDAHPQITGVGELSIMSRIVANMNLRIGSTLTFPECIRDLDASDVQMFADEYVGEVTRRAPGAARTVDKNMALPDHLGIIQALMPQARLFHMQRETIDNCFGIWTEDLNAQHLCAADLFNVGISQRLYELQMRHWREVLDLPILPLEYETLVQDSDSWAHRIIEHTGLPWNDSCLQFHEKRRKDTVATVTNPTLSYNQVRQPIYRTSVARASKFDKHLGRLREGLAEGDRLVKQLLAEIGR